MGCSEPTVTLVCSVAVGTSCCTCAGKTEEGEFPAVDSSTLSLGRI